MKGLAAGGLTVCWLVASGVLLGGPVGMGLFGLAFVLTLTMAAAWWGPVDSIKVERLLPEESVRAGDLVNISWRVSARRWWPWFSLTLEDRGLGGGPEADARLPFLIGRRSHTIRQRLPAAVRGIHRLGAVVLTVSDPFGLVRRQHRLDLPGELEVWPAPVPETEVKALLADAGNGAGRDGRVLWRATPDGQVRGVRRYAPGDPLRLVHWPATAKTGRLMVRQFEGRPAVLRVIMETTNSTGAGRFEHTLSQAAGLFEWGLRHGYAFALTTTDTAEPAGTGVVHFRRLMRLLAAALPQRGAIVLRLLGEERP